MKFRRIMASILAASTMLSFAACSGNETSGTSSTSDAGNTSTSDTSKTDTSDAGTSTSTSDAGTTEKLTLKVLTCRTDRVEDGSLDEYTDAFEAANNCIVEYQGYTDYESDVSTMMNTTEYGDVLMIPGTVKLADLGNFFEPLGTYDEMSQKYNWVDAKMYDNTVYGLPIWGGVSGGICYNKRIWSEAGVTELPKTPEEFLAALKLIEQNTDAIPYYTNYADASWTLVQWAALVNSASGSSTYEQDILKAKRDLFVDGDAYYEVYELMFDIFSDPTLIEEDPMTPDWEGCKKAINDGKIATMVMGSWAVSQFKEAGENPDDIGYMPAPFNVNGKQYAESSPDYALGVNKNRSDEIKELGKKYITWFVEESGFAVKEGCVGTLKGSAMPDYLDAFADCEMFVTETYPDGLVGVWDTINNDSEVGTWQGDAANFKIQIAEAAFAGESKDKVASILADANAKWAATRDANADLEAYLANNG